MMRKFLMIGCFAFITVFPAHAGEIVTIKVNGMVCDFCARAVEKVFSREAAVENVAVDLTEKTITAHLKDDHTLDDEKIGEMVRDSGYALIGISREEAADE